MTTPNLRSVLVLLATAIALCAFQLPDALQAQPANDKQESKQEEAMLIHFLEIVTPDVEGTCSTLEKLHGVSFSPPEPQLGNARTAALEGGGKISVRAPMREDEHPVVRPYVLVEDIGAAVEAAQAAGAEIAIPFMEIPGHGKIAIYILGGIQHGLWQR